MVGRFWAWALLGPALLSTHAAAADADNLLLALKRARTLAVRGQAQVTVNFPPRNSPTRLAAQLPAVAVRPGLLERAFTVAQAGTAQVAGRATVRYDLTPRNPDAPRWTLWIDTAWNLPLAYEERRSDGELARRAVFVKVNSTLARVSRPVPAAPAGLRAALLRAMPGVRLPAGFVPVAVTRQGDRWNVALSDGVNVLALVAAARGVEAAPGVVSRPVEGGFVWLVGNLPQRALEAALAGVRGLRPAALGTFVTPADSNP
ncbi:sigma-E factor regulatory protein RseB domain-containing protein [Deinococcus hohokamensis]|uniref:Sigma-E factor regulatory protein RseB domain-containing protein n=1 Tax=Deinococcus hohokamensis TaxID=309883 RepID=A0ABV9IFN2_9DEIO